MSPIRQESRNIAIVDPQAVFEELREETETAVLEVLASGRYALGPRVEEFEAAACDYLGSAHAFGVSSGTEALLTALQALDVRPGDEVITTAFTFIASATCVARLGVRPVFVDIDPVTYQMAPDALAAAITPRTRAIIAVHLYGHPAPMRRYLELAAEPDEPIAVIEDAAQALGTRCLAASGDAVAAGTLGLFGCFSFYPTKNLPACGEAGLVVTSQQRLAERVQMLRNHGMDGLYRHVLLAGNGRMDALQAAVLGVRLRHLDRWNARRRENAALFDRLFRASGLLDRADLLALPPQPEAGEVATYHQYTLRATRRDELRQALQEEGISSGVYYPIPLPMQPIFQELGYGPGSFPEAEQAASEVISLPVHQYMSADDVERIVAVIDRFYRR